MPRKNRDATAGPTPATLFASLESLLSNAQSDQRQKAAGQFALFVSKPKIKEVEEWADRIRLNDEKHLLGTFDIRRLQK